MVIYKCLKDKIDDLQFYVSKNLKRLDPKVLEVANNDLEDLQTALSELKEISK
jgi:predicted RecB family endonuclease